MDVRQLVPKDYSAYFAHFNRKNYPAFFQRYQALSEPFWAQLTLQETKSAAETLVEYCGTLLRPFSRKVNLFDLKSLFAFYTVPAALEYGGASAPAFARQLTECWNRRYPKFFFSQTTYAELMRGFENTKILGFEIKSKDK